MSGIQQQPERIAEVEKAKETRKTVRHQVQITNGAGKLAELLLGGNGWSSSTDPVGHAWRVIEKLEAVPAVPEPVPVDVENPRNPTIKEQFAKLGADKAHRSAHKEWTAAPYALEVTQRQLECWKLCVEGYTTKKKIGGSVELGTLYHALDLAPKAKEGAIDVPLTRGAAGRLAVLIAELGWTDKVSVLSPACDALALLTPGDEPELEPISFHDPGNPTAAEALVFRAARRAFEAKVKAWRREAFTVSLREDERDACKAAITAAGESHLLGGSREVYDLLGAFNLRTKDPDEEEPAVAEPVEAAPAPAAPESPAEAVAPAV